jgi:hypothetical protein
LSNSDEVQRPEDQRSEVQSQEKMDVPDPERERERERERSFYLLVLFEPSVD